MASVHHRLLLGLLALPVPLVLALQQNITVDDAASTGVIPQYLPATGAWKQGADCSDCLAKPDPSDAVNGTWHDSTFTPSLGSPRAIEITFSGTALYVFFILANTIPDTDTLTNVDFTLDDASAGSFAHEPTSSSDFQYNVPVFVKDSLPSGQHHLRIESVGNRSSLILFDYLIYTSDVEEASSTSFVSDTQEATTTSSSSQAERASSTSFSSDVEVESSTSFRSDADRASSTSTRPDVEGSSSTPFSSDVEEASSTPLTFGPTSSTTVSNPNNTEVPEATSNMGPIVGGAVGGVVGTCIIATALLCFWKRKKRDREMLFPDRIMSERDRDDRIPIPASLPGDARQSGLLPEAMPTPHSDALSVSNPKNAMHQANFGPGTNVHPVTADDTTLLRERVELLVDEVTRLRHLHLQNQNGSELGMEAPPGYSDDRVSPDPFR